MQELNDIFSQTPSSEQASEEPEKIADGEEKVEKVETTDKKEEKEDVKSVEETDKSQEEKPEKKEATQESTEKVEASEKTSESEASSQWESDDNPYKAQTQTLEKRQRDTHTWGNTAHEKALRLEKKLQEALGDDYVVEPSETASTEVLDAEFQGKMKASKKASLEKHGQQHLDEKLYNDDTVWQKVLSHDPAIDMRVRNSDAPVAEALKVVGEYEFARKYGNNSESVKANIRKELEPELREQITKEIQEKLKLKEKHPRGLSGVKGSHSEEAVTEVIPEELEEIFK